MVPQFCDDCGSILDEAADASIVCDVCGKTNSNDLSERSTTSMSTNFPSTLRTRLTSNTQILSQEDRNASNARRIQVACEKCDAKEVTFSEVQLRSADEGSTIFYRCIDCGNRWTDNN